MTFFVCGEALVDLFVRQHAGDIDAEIVLGGSPFNVAISLARLGMNASFFGGLSSDVFGVALKRRLIDEGVNIQQAVNSAALTTISVVSTNAAGHPTYAFHGDSKADRQIQVHDLPADLGRDIETIVLGSYTLSTEPIASALLVLAKREYGRRVISIDPNLRSTVTPNMAVWGAQFARFLPFATIVKASDEDLAQAYPGARIEELARTWFAQGVQLVVITHGANGATAMRSGQKRLTIPGRTIDVVDTVGAGDSFHAAMLTRFHEQQRLTLGALSEASESEVIDAISFAIEVSAITCSRRGSNSPRRDELG